MLRVAESAPSPTRENAPVKARPDSLSNSSPSAFPCPLCRGGFVRRLFDFDARFHLAECAGCGLVLTVPRLSAEEIGDYYPPEYYGDENRRFNPLFEWLITVFRRRRVRRIRAYVAKGRVLDVGCGRGLTLSYLAEDGWSVQGVEISDVAAGHARSVLGIPVHTGDVLSTPFDEGSFDVVVLWHSLEHFAEPGAVLDRCARLLAPGGLLVVAVPNYESLQARASGRSWFHLDVPRHYVHFRLGVLVQALNARGLDVREVSHFALEQNPYGWIQSLLNLVGFRHNLLYELLKNPSARAERFALHRHAFQVLGTVLALPFVVALTCVLFLVELVFRLGGTIELYAVRRGSEPSPSRR